MPRQLVMPAFLDAQGHATWQVFVTSRERAHTAKRDLRHAKSAMRQTSRPGDETNPAIAARYQSARLAAVEADETWRFVERAYHVCRRAPRGQPRPEPCQPVVSRHGHPSRLSRRSCRLICI